MTYPKCPSCKTTMRRWHEDWLCPRCGYGYAIDESIAEPYKPTS